MSDTRNPSLDRHLADGFARRLRPQLLAYFRRRLMNEERAEELAQDCILRFLKGGYDPSSTEARPIIFGIARNMLSDEISRRRRDNEQLAPAIEDDVLPELVCSAPTQDRIVESRTELARVSAIIEQLPERTRVIFLLSRMHGLKHAEIAAELGISKSAVEKHIMEAVSRLLRASKRSLR